MTLKGRTLVITGASRGIGLAIALRAARDGANIAIAAKTDKPHPKLPGTIFTAADEIAKAGGQALPLVVDVRDEAQVKGAIERTVATFGGIDIVVNNASAVQRTPVVDTDMRRFDLMHQIKAAHIGIHDRRSLDGARIVDHDVDAAKGRDGPLDRAFHLRLVAHVDHERQ